MKIRYILIISYFFIGLLFAVYGYHFGEYAYRGFAYNLGMGIVWPAVLFPSFGRAIGGFIMVSFVLYITFFHKR